MLFQISTYQISTTSKALFGFRNKVSSILFDCLIRLDKLGMNPISSLNENPIYDIIFDDDVKHF